MSCIIGAYCSSHEVIHGDIGLADPCPHCGGTDVDFDGGPHDVSVQCQDCLATGPVATIGCRDLEEEEIRIEDEAVELWNKRAKPNSDGDAANG